MAYRLLHTTRGRLIAYHLAGSFAARLQYGFRLLHDFRPDDWGWGKVTKWIPARKPWYNDYDVRHCDELDIAIPSPSEFLVILRVGKFRDDGVDDFETPWIRLFPGKPTSLVSQHVAGSRRMGTAQGKSDGGASTSASQASVYARGKGRWNANQKRIAACARASTELAKGTASSYFANHGGSKGNIDELPASTKGAESSPPTTSSKITKALEAGSTRTTYPIPVGGADSRRVVRGRHGILAVQLTVANDGDDEE